jgi:hypothetical protein
MAYLGCGQEKKNTTLGCYLRFRTPVGCQCDLMLWSKMKRLVGAGPPVDAPTSLFPAHDLQLLHLHQHPSAFAQLPQHY